MSLINVTVIEKELRESAFPLIGGEGSPRGGPHAGEAVVRQALPDVLRQPDGQRLDSDANGCGRAGAHPGCFASDFDDLEAAQQRADHHL